jgi:adenylate cyclase
MKPQGETGLEGFSGLLREEINGALEKGGLISALFGISAGILLTILILLRAAENLLLPLVFAFFAGGYSLVIYALARKRAMRGWVIHALFLPFVSLPTFFFLACHLTMPAGAATYMTGPISYLYFHLIIMTGFIFDVKLSVSAGVICAAGYQLVFLLGRDAISRVTVPDPTLLQDLTSLPIYSVKSFMMLFGGFVVGGLSAHVKRLIVKILAESREKDRISRLFGQYVSNEVKERIIHEKAGVIGEKKEVAILFSDIRNFSTFSEAHPPEVIVTRLNEYFERMVDSITRNGGVVDKFVGDAIMGVFGGVIRLDAPCDSAVRAALSMREGLHAMNELKESSAPGAFDNGVGIHFGEVLQGSIGSRDRKEFTVIGDNVNIASRVEGLTKMYAFKIIVTGAVAERLSDPLRQRCVFIDKVTVKGKTREVEIFGIKDDA